MAVTGKTVQLRHLQTGKIGAPMAERFARDLAKRSMRKNSQKKRVPIYEVVEPQRIEVPPVIKAVKAETQGGATVKKNHAEAVEASADPKENGSTNGFAQLPLKKLVPIIEQTSDIEVLQSMLSDERKTVVQLAKKRIKDVQG